MEKRLSSQAEAKGFSEERKNAYVYGTMRKTGWTPSTQRVSSYKKLKSK